MANWGTELRGNPTHQPKSPKETDQTRPPPPESTKESPDEQQPRPQSNHPPLQPEPGSRTATAHARKPCHSKEPPSQTGQERTKSLCCEAATADRILHQKISFFRDQTRRSWKGDEREERQVGLNNEAQRKRRMRERKGGGGIQPIKIATFAALLCLAPAPRGLVVSPTRNQAGKKSQKSHGRNGILDGGRERELKWTKRIKTSVVVL